MHSLVLFKYFHETIPGMLDICPFSVSCVRKSTCSTSILGEGLMILLLALWEEGVVMSSNLRDLGGVVMSSNPRDLGDVVKIFTDSTL